MSEISQKPKCESARSGCKETVYGLCYVCGRPLCEALQPFEPKGRQASLGKAIARLLLLLAVVVIAWDLSGSHVFEQWVPTVGHSFRAVWSASEEVPTVGDWTVAIVIFLVALLVVTSFLQVLCDGRTARLCLGAVIVLAASSLVHRHEPPGMSPELLAAIRVTGIGGAILLLLLAFSTFIIAKLGFKRTDTCGWIVYSRDFAETAELLPGVSQGSGYKSVAVFGGIILLVGAAAIYYLRTLPASDNSPYYIYGSTRAIVVGLILLCYALVGFALQRFTHKGVINKGLAALVCSQCMDAGTRAKNWAAGPKTTTAAL